jgi:hypothetical protein
VNFTIVSGNITASSSSSGSASGIGSGFDADGGASTIKANGTRAGIGSGVDGGGVGQLTFSGTVSLICDVNGTAFPINALSILLSNASLIVGTHGDRLFGVNPFRQGWLNLTILYGAATLDDSAQFSTLNSVILEIANLSFNRPMGAALPWTFCISQGDTADCLATQSTEMTEVRSAFVSLPSVGFYSIRALFDDWIGVLETPDGERLFNVSSNFSVVGDAKFAWHSQPLTALPTASFTVPLLVLLHPGSMLLVGFALFVLPFWD